MSYALEKLGLAIYELTVGEDDIKVRLEGVIKYLAPLSDSDFPIELRELWSSIHVRLTFRESNVAGTKYDEGRYEASLYGMRKKKAAEVVKDIVEIYDMLKAYIDDGRWQ